MTDETMQPPVEDTHNRSDDALMQAIAMRDEHALRLLYERHAPWLAVRLRRVLAASVVEDVLQETFLAIWKNGSSYQSTGEVGAWLWGIARRQGAQWARKHYRPALALDLLGERADQNTDPAHEVVHRNETLLVHLAAAMLASIIGIAVWTPFGETERVSPLVLPVMRGVHLLSLCVIGCVVIAWVISGWSDVISDISLASLFIRNSLFLTGCVLLAGRIVDVRLSWLLPILFGGVTIVGLLQRMRRIERVEELWQGSPWNLLALNGTYGMANAICIGVGIAAVAVYIRDGVRDTDEAE